MMTTEIPLTVGATVKVEGIIPHDDYRENLGSWQSAEVSAHSRFIGKKGSVLSVDRDGYIPVLVLVEGKERRFRKEELTVV